MSDKSVMNGGEKGVGNRAPPYISFKTLLTFIDDQKEHGVLNSIDRSVLTRFSGSVSGQLIAGLKFLGLIDQNQEVQPALRELVDARNTDKWREALGSLLRSAYAPLMGEDLSGMTPAKFHDLFKTLYPAKDAVARKCEVFFLKAAEAAGVNVNLRIIKHRAPRSVAGQKPSRKRRQPSGTEPEHDHNKHVGGRQGAIAEKTDYDFLIGILDPESMEEEEQKAVWTLIRYLKRVEVADE